MTYLSTKDKFQGRANVARRGDLVVPSDTTDFTTYIMAFVAGGTGTVKYIPAGNWFVNDAGAAIADDDDDAGDINDLAVVITGAPIGYIIPHLIRRVFATGTDATLYTLGL